MRGGPRANQDEPAPSTDLPMTGRTKKNQTSPSISSLGKAEEGQGGGEHTHMRVCRWRTTAFQTLYVL